MSDKRRLRAGVVGAGAIAQACHLPGYANNAHVNLVAFADPVLAQHKETLAKYPGLQAYSDFYEMLDELELDVVSVCTPNAHHAAAAIHAMHAGAHVLCEKPMALTLEEADRMARVADATGKTLMIGFTHRLYSGPAKCHELLTQQAIGDVFMIRVRFAHGGPFPGWARSDWFYKPVQSGGGALLDMGIHAIDICQWLVGPITHVQARAATLVKPIAVDDNAVLIVEFSRGALGYIEVGWTSGPGFAGFEV
ncbi:MAG: Gfo/Idh/MocA family oxidoreductase, partial [Candidatus Hydrogenedentes bacterium]|nr:Gfo/Idh/MocA family oxidoreductase [Candidatus Hydrogenedentota bacterium]